MKTSRLSILYRETKKKLQGHVKNEIYYLYPVFRLLTRYEKRLQSLSTNVDLTNILAS